MNTEEEVENPVCLSGILQKRGPTKKHAWKPRFVVLERNVLRYYKKENDSTELGSIPLNKVLSFSITGGNVVPPKPDLAGLVFTLDVTQDTGLPRTFCFCCGSSIQRNMWINGITVNMRIYKNSPTNVISAPTLVEKLHIDASMSPSDIIDALAASPRTRGHTTSTTQTQSSVGRVSPVYRRNTDTVPLYKSSNVALPPLPASNRPVTRSADHGISKARPPPPSRKPGMPPPDHSTIPNPRVNSQYYPETRSTDQQQRQAPSVRVDTPITRKLHHQQQQQQHQQQHQQHQQYQHQHQRQPSPLPAVRKERPLPKVRNDVNNENPPSLPPLQQVAPPVRSLPASKQGQYAAQKQPVKQQQQRPVKAAPQPQQRKVFEEIDEEFVDMDQMEELDTLPDDSTNTLVSELDTRIAMWDFEPLNEEEDQIVLQAGDKVIVLQEEGEWICVENTRSGENGWIPGSFVATL